MLSSEIFHESNEKFGESVVQNEGLLNYFSKNIHLFILILIGFKFSAKLYSSQWELLLYLEDYQDFCYFEYIKKIGQHQILTQGDDIYKMSGPQFWIKLG